MSKRTWYYITLYFTVGWLIAVGLYILVMVLIPLIDLSLNLSIFTALFGFGGIILYSIPLFVVNLIFLYWLKRRK